MNKEIHIYLTVLATSFIIFAFLIGLGVGYKEGQTDALQGIFKYKLEKQITNIAIKLP